MKRHLRLTTLVLTLLIAVASATLWALDDWIDGSLYSQPGQRAGLSATVDRGVVYVRETPIPLPPPAGEKYGSCMVGDVEASADVDGGGDAAGPGVRLLIRGVRVWGWGAI